MRRGRRARARSSEAGRRRRRARPARRSRLQSARFVRPARTSDGRNATRKACRHARQTSRPRRSRRRHCECPRRSERLRRRRSPFASPCATSRNRLSASAIARFLNGRGTENVRWKRRFGQYDEIGARGRLTDRLDDLLERIRKIGAIVRPKLHCGDADRTSHAGDWFAAEKGLTLSTRVLREGCEREVGKGVLPKGCYRRSCGARREMLPNVKRAISTLSLASCIASSVRLSQRRRPNRRVATSPEASATPSKNKDVCGATKSKWAHLQCEQFNSSAPGDEYFGRMKMSYLGIDNTYKDGAISAGRLYDRSAGSFRSSTLPPKRCSAGRPSIRTIRSWRARISSAFKCCEKCTRRPSNRRPGSSSRSSSQDTRTPISVRR